MDAVQFDALARALGARTSRRLLAGLASVPLLGGLAALGELDEAAAKNNKKKRKKRKQKKKCNKQKATRCAGKCGTIKCKKNKLNCGGCSDPTTPVCRNNVCEACSSDADCPGGQVCREDGSCGACEGDACPDCDVCPSGCQFTTIQQAINAVPTGGTATIRICAGIYTRSGTNPVANIAGKNLTLIGAGAAQTILDGQGIVSGMPVIQAYSTSSVPQITTVLQQLTVTGANGAPGIGHGGSGPFNPGTGNILTLSQVTVRDNETPGSGAGIWHFAGTLVLDTGTHVHDNESDDVGGGIYNSSGAVTLNDGASVRDNHADKRGGGIYNSVEGTVTLKNGARVSGNEAKGIGIDPELTLGGGIYSQGTVTLEVGSLICDNTPEDCAGTNPLAWSPSICANSQCPG